MRECVIKNFKRLEDGLAESKDLDDFREKIPSYFNNALSDFNGSARKFLEGIVETKKEIFADISGYTHNFKYCYGLRERYLRASRLFDALLDLSVDIYSCEHGKGKLRFDFRDYEDIRREFIERYIR